MGLPLLLAAAFDLSAGVWIPLLAVGLIAAGVIGRRLYEQWTLSVRPHREPLREPIPEPAPQPVVEDVVVEGVQLRSAAPDYRFTFSCRVHWHSLVPGTHGDRAIRSILDRAARVTASIRPEELDAAARAVTAEVEARRPDGHGVGTWASEVVLALPEEDARRLARMAELRKDEELWDRERAQERNMRRYLTDDVFETPGSAVAWWLAGHRAEPVQTLDLAPTLARLSAIIRGELEPSSVTSPVLEPKSLFERICDVVDSVHEDQGRRLVLVHDLARVLDGNGQSALSGELRNRYGVDDLSMVVDDGSG
ncbi:hypothetical protein UO65_0431 [Actinokineospora spheciospongiae]|uniref:Uncharacterized protein n=1 Tax=Actinokineospora spheciospongiae TaxID=909613 RepID=W7J5G6_9PSEU|nr:hypothetical protein UO65_0431 [Actinokineospora spheciospongiae]